MTKERDRALKTSLSISALDQAMNVIVQKSFDSLEASLAVLIESVSSYNPSPAAAIAVVNADDVLTAGLEQCVF